MLIKFSHARRIAASPLRYFSPLLLLFVSFCTAPSQGAVIRVGPSLGIHLNFPSASSKPSDASFGVLGNEGPRWGLLAGAVIESRLNDYLWIESGFRYIQTGARLELLGLVEGTVRLDYLEVPVVLRSCWGSDWAFCAAGGFHLSLAINRSIEFLDSLVVADLSDRFNGVNVGLDAGVGVQKLFGQFILLGELRLIYGLFDLDSHFEDDYFARGLLTTVTGKWQF